MNNVVVYIKKGREFVPLGLLDRSRIDWFVLFNAGSWRMPLVPKVDYISIQRQLACEDVLFPVAGFVLAYDHDHHELVVCVEGSKHLIDYDDFASFPEGRKWAN